MGRLQKGTVMRRMKLKEIQNWVPPPGIAGIQTSGNTAPGSTCP
jgi:hypothetical protein